jgi:hypothetical protein
MFSEEPRRRGVSEYLSDIFVRNEHTEERNEEKESEKNRICNHVGVLKTNRLCIIVWNARWRKMKKKVETDLHE